MPVKGIESLKNVERFFIKAARDFPNIVNKASENLSKQLEKDIKSKYIDRAYKEYIPKYYERTFKMYDDFFVKSGYASAKKTTISFGWKSKKGFRHAYFTYGDGKMMFQPKHVKTRIPSRKLFPTTLEEMRKFNIIKGLREEIVKTLQKLQRNFGLYAKK